MKWVVGIDEVGRGPLAGPVMVCAVALPLRTYTAMRWKKGLPPLNDSKLMTENHRVIWEKEARRNGSKIAVATKSASMIDARGISRCISECVHIVLKKLDLDPKNCIVYLDGGLKAPAVFKKQTTVIKGDRLHPIISLASVIAKVRRDALMRKHHQKHPSYAWETNKGYGTTKHLQALRAYGPTPLHRKTFISKGF